MIEKHCLAMELNYQFLSREHRFKNCARSSGVRNIVTNARFLHCGGDLQHTVRALNNIEIILFSFWSNGVRLLEKFIMIIDNHYFYNFSSYIYHLLLFTDTGNAINSLIRIFIIILSIFSIEYCSIILAQPT